METKFKSQICTTREQSERLLQLGLKKETADMSYNYQRTRGDYELSVNAYADILRLKDRMNNRKVLGMGWDELWGNDLPAWSLHRLIEMMPRTVKVDGRVYGCMMELGGCVQYINLLVNEVIWATHYSVSNSFDGLIDCIEWLIKEGYFNKEYLV